MKAPSSRTLLTLAIGLFFLAAITEPGLYYPAAHPLLGPDGKQLHGADGLPICQRDMTKYYEIVAPSILLFSLSAIGFLWLLVRSGKWIYYHLSPSIDNFRKHRGIG